jgi:DNA modification methylase
MNIHRIIQGDCIAGMRILPDGCIQTCITSPPYFALRDYSGGEEEIGQEDTVEGYVQKMVEVFREVRRILRDDGTVWLNLGDSYMSAKGCSPPPQTLGKGAADGQPKDFVPPNRKDQKGLKDKDLIGIPWRVAFALQADGWYLRQDIIWNKPNPMPESVTDRCTKSHEYIFLLSKKKHYYFDHEVIREPAALTTHARLLRGVSDTHKNVDGAPGQPPHSMNKPRKNARAFGAKVQEGTKRGDVGNTFVDTGKRNKRSVWTITTKPFRGAHFATYPKDLITPCVLAGTSEHGCCSKCGAPWERQVESTRIARNELPPEDPRYRPNTYKGAYGEINGKGDAGYNSTKTLGWAASCKCKDAEVVPCTVFDPFTGSGTTAVVALQHGRNYIGTELNPQYIKIAEARIMDEVPNTLQEFIK